MVYAKTGIKAFWSCPILIFSFFAKYFVTDYSVVFKIYNNSFCLRSFEDQVGLSHGGKVKKIQSDRPLPNDK